MKQGQIIKAYKALDKLMAQDVPLQIAFSVFEMREKLRPSWEFQIVEEEKIQKKYPNVNFETLSVQWTRDDEADKKLKLAELNACEKDFEALTLLDRVLEIEPIQIPMHEVSIKMAGKDIEALKGFIEFTQ